jgi:hypothetical protein
VTHDPDEVAALVLLKPASGREITGESKITAATLREFAPDPSDAAAAGRALAEAGFEVGPVLGIAMRVKGRTGSSRSTSTRACHQLTRGGWVAVDANGTTSRELPVSKVPDALATRIHAATFEPPAETVEADVALP